MEKLELKHLAGYLPYELKALCVRTKEVRTVTLLHFTYDLRTVGHNHLIYEGVLLEKHKPILRPLSYLTKEIDVNREKFVPIDRLEMYGYYDRQCLEYNQVKSISYNMIQYLYEWHFDIHGLIEKGLAIDINTLKQ